MTTHNMTFDCDNTKLMYGQIVKTYKLNNLQIHEKLNEIEKLHITKKTVQLLIENYNNNYSNITHTVLVPLYDLPMF